MSKDWNGGFNSVFKCLGASSHTEKEREPNDYYATSPEAIDLLFESDNFVRPKYVWECACGEGHLAKRLNLALYLGILQTIAVVAKPEAIATEHGEKNKVQKRIV